MCVCVVAVFDLVEPASTGCYDFYSWLCLKDARDAGFRGVDIDLWDALGMYLDIARFAIVVQFLPAWYF